MLSQRGKYAIRTAFELPCHSTSKCICPSLRAAEMDEGTIPHEDEDQRLERLHFANVLKAFDDYLPYCLTANDARRKSYFSLPRAHQQLLSDLGQDLPLPELQNGATRVEQLRGFKSRLEEIDDRIRRNADLLTLIADESRGFLGSDIAEEDTATDEAQANQEAGQAASSSSNSSSSSTGKVARKRRRISGHEIDKIQSTLKQFVRDWSREGEAERSTVYEPLMNAVSSRYGGIPFQERGHVRILVPGAGLGRLAFEFAAQGYSCQGNEFSFYMLLASHYILNKSSQKEQHTIYPFVHSSSNWRTADDMLRPIRIPDVLPSSLPPTSDFSMVAGEFCEVYTKPEEKRAWHVVATCFFIDTAKNVLRYLETLNHLLPVGGHWINAGPLLWHFENSGNSRGGSSDSMSIELTLDELVQLLPKLGFELEVSVRTRRKWIGGRWTDAPPFTVCRNVVHYHRRLTQACSTVCCSTITCPNSSFVAKSGMSNRHPLYSIELRRRMCHSIFSQDFDYRIGTVSFLDMGLGVGLGSLEALLGLLEVDDRPDVLEIVCGRGYR